MLLCIPTEFTRPMPRLGVVLSAVGRAYDLCGGERKWGPGWRRE